MIKKTTLLLILIALSPVLQAQQSLSKEQKPVQQTVARFFEALSNRDSVQLKNYCTTNIQLYENGDSWNLDSLILKAITLNTATDFKRSNTFDFINTTLNKTTAWATYKLQSEISRAGKHITIQWLETVVLIKEHRQWKICILHSTLLKRT